MTEIDPRLLKARSGLIINHPFFGSLIMRLEAVASDRHATMATDGKRMFYNPRFLDESDITEPVLEFVVAHEGLHCALGHHARRGDRDHNRWNIACDYAINYMLVEAGMKRPEWVYYDRRFADFSAEEIYRILEAEEKAQQPPPEPEPSPEPVGADEGDDENPDQGDQQDDPGSEDAEDDDGDQDGGDGQDGDQGDQGQPSQDHPDDQNGGDAAGGPGEGTGETGEDAGPAGHGDPGRCGEVLDAAPDHDTAALDESKAEWEVFTRQAVNIARKQGEGKLPGFIEEIVTALDKPSIDWRDVLQRFIDPSSIKDFSWTNPSRRMIPAGYIVPGMVTDGVSHIAMLIDTSGSIDSEWLRKFGAEVQSALDNGTIDKLTLVFGDTQVNRTAEYSKGDEIDFTCEGRGGTRFAPLIEWVIENEPGVVAAIYFTDLDCSAYGDEPPFPMLWAAYGNPIFLKPAMEKVPFGEVVELAD